MRLPDYCTLYMDEGEHFEEAKEQIDRLAKYHASQVFFDVVGYANQKEEAQDLIKRIEDYSKKVLGFPCDVVFTDREEFDR